MPDDLRKGQNAALMGLVWWFGNKQGAWSAMSDAIFVVLSILFFVLGAAYVAGCRHLAPKGRS